MISSNQDSIFHDATATTIIPASVTSTGRTLDTTTTAGITRTHHRRDFEDAAAHQHNSLEVSYSTFQNMPEAVAEPERPSDIIATVGTIPVAELSPLRNVYFPKRASTISLHIFNQPSNGTLDHGVSVDGDPSVNSPATLPTSIARLVTPKDSLDPELRGSTWRGRQPTYVSVTIHKTKHDLVPAIAFKRVDGNLTISWIEPSITPLKVGMRVISLNHRSCADWNEDKTASLLTSVVGNLHIVAFNESGDPNYAQAMASKATPNSLIGIVFAQRSNLLRVGAIRPNSPFAQSVLNSGDFILAINNLQASSLTATEAASIVSNARGAINILKFLALMEEAKTEAEEGFAKLRVLLDVLLVRGILLF